jgi:hypothetical protein
MSRQASTSFVICAVAVLVAFLAFFALRDRRPHEGTASMAAPLVPSPLVPSPLAVEPAMHETIPSVSPRAAAATSAGADHDGPQLDQAALMETLRTLRGSNPTLTLQLAREGNQRFEESAETAERSWFIVKSLSDLGRHDEARTEGRALVEKYRGTRWAEDVYRHLFVNPPTHPFERGYGKVLEGDP